MWVLLQYTSKNLAFKSLLCNFSRKTMGKIAEILVFKMSLKIHCKLSYKYLTMKDIVKDFGAKLRAELEIKDYFRTRDFYNWFISLSIR